MEEFTFYKKGGRPRELSKKEAYEAKLEAKRRWRKKNKKRVSVYNELYRGKSKRESRKRSKRKSRKSSKRESRKRSTRRKSSSNTRENRKHKITLLKVNPDGSKIVLIK